MASIHDGPRSPLFRAVPLKGNTTFSRLKEAGASRAMCEAASRAPTGQCTCWGIPFEVKKPLFAKEETVSVPLGCSRVTWLVFMHTTDIEAIDWNEHGFLSPTRGIGRLAEPVADYVFEYRDGTEIRQTILRRHQIGMFSRIWGENCFKAVASSKPFSIPPVHEQVIPPPPGATEGYYGGSQTRVRQPDILPWVNWLWAWENPYPEKRIVSLRIEPKGWGVLLSGVSAGNATSLPLRWEPRKKVILNLPKGVLFDRALSEHGLYKQIQIDLGQIISAVPRAIYPNDTWSESYNNQLPEISDREVLVEYTCHRDAKFHVAGRMIAVSDLEKGTKAGPLTPVSPTARRVSFRVIDKTSKRPVPVKLHVHGEAGEYLAPLDRHRFINYGWIEDYAPEFLHQQRHACTYISGEATLDLPIGNVFIEVSKGFEIRPIRRVQRITPATESITIEIERVLPWRERGWVTADTHVHFLSPQTAMLEGSAEGVNVVNLLASQWGELMTNVGDFDGKTTFGSKEAGGDGEWLVRVGTENRQHVLGHISLLGYRGNLIAPLCVGGPDESALGDPVGVLLSEWARQCKSQGGLVVMPHFPNPRCENAANLISGDVDAVEMTSWGNLYGGIDPYSLSDWYRYLNCGYFHAAVGGTDKMTASTAVGAIRTYAHLEEDQAFTYEAWMEAVRKGHTFVTYGPLLEFSVDGHRSGSWISMKSSGGTVEVEWRAATVTVPMTRVELIVNGEIRESQSVGAWEAEGHWSTSIGKSSWIAVLVRGKYADKPEVIIAHTSPVMIPVEGSPFFAAADALTILEQIEGALAYLDTLGTRCEVERHKRMWLTLTSAHRRLHNELHAHGHFHTHTHPHDHPEHRD